VWAHTRLVVAELERLTDWPSLDRDDRLKLLFTALFHDSGKPAMTQTDPATGRTRSPSTRQPAKGSAAASSEASAATSSCARDRGAHPLHGRPPYLLEKADPAREVIGLSWLVSHRLLYLFALATHAGV